MHVRAKNASDFKDWQFILETHRKIVREWFTHLSTLQRLAVLFVYDRTLGWGKEWERITMDQCVQGIVSEEGVRYAAPFTSCRKRASLVFKSLVQLGALRTEKIGWDRASRYALNFDWTPEMQLPKRLRNGNGSDNGGGNAPLDRGGNAPLMGAETPRYKRVEVKRSEKGRVASASAREGRGELEMAVVEVRKRSKDKSALKKMQGRPLRANGTGFLPNKNRIPLFWKDLWIEYFPGEQLDPMTLASQQILWQYWKKWTEARSEGEFLDYLTWVFQYWNTIRIGSFAWMQSFPKVPALRMLTSGKLRVFFEEAYRERQTVETLSKLQPHERKLRELVEGGMAPEHAQEIVDREFASRREAKELRAARDRLAVMMETHHRREASRKRREDEQPAFKAPRKRSLPVTNNFGKWKEDR